MIFKGVPHLKCMIFSLTLVWQNDLTKGTSGEFNAALGLTVTPYTYYIYAVTVGPSEA
jgi:hypothetical protein